LFDALRGIIDVILDQINFGYSKTVVVPDFLEDLVVKSLVLLTFNDFAFYRVILNLYQDL
jgi:hypothetical protein